MKLKEIFGAVLIVLGIAGMIYVSVVFADTVGTVRNIKALLIEGILGLTFFISGISLANTAKTTPDV